MKKRNFIGNLVLVGAITAGSAIGVNEMNGIVDEAFKNAHPSYTMNIYKKKLAEAEKELDAYNQGELNKTLGINMENITGTN